jgi:WD40 repeat protein
MSTVPGDDRSPLPDSVAGPAAGPPRRQAPDIREWLRQAGDLSVTEVVDALQHDQLQRWRHGERVPAETYLQILSQQRPPESTTPADTEEALDLIYAEFLLRRQRGEAPPLDEYLWRFPRYAPQLRLLVELEQQLESGPGGETDHSVRESTQDGADDPSLPAAPAARPTVAGYEILGELGRGGMGVVYRARQTPLNRLVALKMIRTGHDADPGALARFRVEAEAVARLQHPHIVQIYEIGGLDGTASVCPYMALELVEGGSLARQVNGTPLPVRRAAELVETLARAMHFAHQRGILHRDLKPGNILLASAGGGPSQGSAPDNVAPAGGSHPPLADWVPKITDFGLAKRLEEGEAGQTRTGSVLGTPGYMAPEQAAGQGRDVGVPTDVYALGAVLYALLTCRPPFRAETPLATLELVRGAEPVPPGRLRAGVPRGLETICLKCLRKEPQRRYASALALAEDLRRYLAGEPIQARRVGAAGRLALWCRRKPALASTIALAVLAVAAVAGVGFWRVVDERDRYRAERDRAEGNLYRSLVSDARARMQARQTGWWWQAMDNLRDAARLDVPARDRAELRELAIECMGSSYPCFRLHGTWAGHDGRVTAVACSPDGRRAVSGSADRTVRLWSVPDGEPLAVLRGPTQAVTGVAFHPDGRLLAACSADGTVDLWDVGSLPPPAVQSVALQGGPVNAVEFSRDGLWLAAGCADGTVRLLAVAGGRLATPGAPGSRPAGPRPRVLAGHTEPVNCLAFSPSGKLASASRDRTIRFWDVVTGKQTLSWNLGGALGNLPSSLAFQFRPSEEVLAWADLATFGICMRYLGTDRQGWQAHLHAGGVTQIRRTGVLGSSWLTASTDGTMRLWQGHSTRPFRELAVARAEFGAILSADLSPDDGWVVAGYADGRVGLWQLAEPPQRALTLDRAQNAVFIGSQRRLVDAAYVYDFPSGTSAHARPYTPAAVYALAIHPAGQAFVCGKEDGTLQIGNLPERRAAARWQGHGGRVTALAGNPDGKQWASASLDGTVKLWDWHDNRLLRTLDPGLGAVHALAWSRDGHSLAATGERGVALWDLRVGGEPRRLGEHSLQASAVAFGLDTLAFSGPGAAITVRHFPSGRTLHTLRGHGAAPSALEFSPDGKQLASAAADGTVRLWDSASGSSRAVFRQEGLNGRFLTFDPRGRYLGVSAVHTCLFYDLHNGTEAAAVENAGMHLSARFLPDGSGALFGTSQGAVLACAAADLDRVRAGAAEGPAPSGAVQADITTTVIAGGHTSEVWGVAASPDGRWVATASHDRTVKLWDGQTLQLVRTLEGHSNIVWCVAFSPDSRYLASGSAKENSGEVKVWEVATGRQVHHFEGHKRLVAGLAFDPVRPRLASSSNDGSVYLWDLESGRSLGLLHQFGQAVPRVTFRPDGRWLAAACVDHRVAVWEMSDAAPATQPPRHLLTGHTGEVWSVAFSPDGRYLASGSDEGVVILWDGQTFERVVTLRAGTGQVRGLSFSQDGELLAAAAYVSPAVVWDLAHLRRSLHEINLDW